MLNMMRLDWLGMRTYRSRFVISAISSVAWGILFHTGLVIPYLVWGMFDASLYCFDAEEKGKLNQLYLTLPISRKTLISARYILSLILQFIGIVAGVVFTVVSSRIMYGRAIINEHNFIPTPESLALIVCASLLFCAVLSLVIHPILHKFGYAKAKILGYALPMYGSIILIVVFILVAARVEAVGEFMDSALQWALGNAVLASVAILGVTALFFVASYALSLRTYAKRDF
ncbi:MAG: ABC-2 transporter permease [Defluviitaleaceae bacterium]|nr:ABC-2 transporter permease [Defluviitaleaceae bacterium]